MILGRLLSFSARIRREINAERVYVIWIKSPQKCSKTASSCYNSQETKQKGFKPYISRQD